MNSRPLNILFILPCPWDARLGQARASIGLAEALTSLGHRCEHFTQAESGIPSGRISGPLLAAWRFHRKVRDHIRREGSRYDVIQVEQNLLRFPRRDYRFGGTVVAKSVGLAHFYQKYEHTIERQLRAQRGDWGTLGGRIVRGMGRMLDGGLRVVENGFDGADQIHLNNGDEFAFIKGNPRWSDKAVLVKSGISESEKQKLNASHEAGRRLNSSTVVSIGQWSYRKGKAEMPAIVRKVREARPDARFRLIGTGFSSESVVSHFDEVDRPFIHVVPSYQRSELPPLLDEARAGLLPSYIEGFGFAWLEVLAAGLPVISWDVPGVRQMLRELPPFMMLPPPSVESTAAAVVKLLSLSPIDYAELCEKAQKVAAMFQWPQIAAIWEQAVMQQVDGKELAGKIGLPVGTVRPSPVL